jgi:hypothetical protein
VPLIVHKGGSILLSDTYFSNVCLSSQSLVVLFASQDIVDLLMLRINNSIFDNIEAQGDFTTIVSTSVEKVW